MGILRPRSSATGLLLLLLLPALSRTWRRVAVLVAAAMVVGIGFSWVALAVTLVSDVLAVFALGAVWLGLMTAIFPWRHIDDVRAAVTVLRRRRANRQPVPLSAP